MRKYLALLILIFECSYPLSGNVPLFSIIRSHNHDNFNKQINQLKLELNAYEKQSAELLAKEKEKHIFAFEKNFLLFKLECLAVKINILGGELGHTHKLTELLNVIKCQYEVVIKRLS